MKNHFHTTIILITAFLTLALSGCISPGKPPHYAYGTPRAVISPALITGCGYGYWYGGRFWSYRIGYTFYNGHYYNGTGRSGGNKGYGGWGPNGGYR